MPTSDSSNVTWLLAELRGGNRAVVNELFGLVYQELHELAHRQRFDGNQTLDTTGLVHEAYLKLVDQSRAQWNDRAHFLAVAAKVMRHLLVDHARSRQALKRGGDVRKLSFEEVQASLDRAPAFDEAHVEVLLVLEDVLRRLEQLSERQSRIVECRFYAGMTIAETATALSIAPATVGRGWELARAWLYREMQRELT